MEDESMLSDMSDFDPESEQREVWYNASDTSEDIPDENGTKEALFQKENYLPVPLLRSHFEEGIICVMTLKFRCRVFFVRGSKQKTYHDGVNDKHYDYTDVWRLAPREELMRPKQPQYIRVGQSIRFEIDDKIITALVTATTSRTIR